MLKFILISIFSYLLGVFSVIIFSIMKVSSKTSRVEENKMDWFKYGQDAYDEIEKRTKENEKDN